MSRKSERKDEFYDDKLGGGQLVSDHGSKNMKIKQPFAFALFEWMDSFVVSIIIVILLFTFFLGKVEVDGESMMNTLVNHDQLIISDFNYTPDNGDIVIISRNYANTEESALTAQKPLVKRIIALPGQSIEIKEGYVYVDGTKLIEDYAKAPTPNKGFTGVQYVPEGCVFVMGDNRGNSHDSRSPDIGFVNQKYILGKVLCRIYPFDQIKTF